MPEPFKRPRTGSAIFPAKVQPLKTLPFLPKRLSRRTLDFFWEDYHSKEQYFGTRANKKLHRFHSRRVFAVSPSVLGTVRIFKSPERAREYVRTSGAIVKSVNSRNPKKFRLFRTQILDIKGNMVLERVYPRPSLFDLGNRYPLETEIQSIRYAKQFFDLMKRRGVSRAEIANSSQLAYNELLASIPNSLTFDWTEQNILVLDYQPKTKRFLFGLVNILE